MKYPCIFGGSFIREVIDPRVQALWKETRDASAPFGALRRSWREAHCPTLNPYGSEDCPYSEEDCGMAFLGAVQQSVHKREPRSYFRVVARSLAADRADNKPLARDRLRTDAQRPSDPGRHRQGDVSRPQRDGEDPGRTRVHQVDGDVLPEQQGGVHRPSRGPERLGDLLGSINLRTRQDRPTDGKESPK